MFYPLLLTDSLLKSDVKKSRSYHAVGEGGLWKATCLKAKPAHLWLKKNTVIMLTNSDYFASPYFKLCTNFSYCLVLFDLQTAEKIMQQNRSCLGLRMVCDPLLKEKVGGFHST